MEKNDKVKKMDYKVFDNMKDVSSFDSLSKRLIDILKKEPKEIEKLNRILKTMPEELSLIFEELRNNNIIEFKGGFVGLTLKYRGEKNWKKN